MQTSTTLYQQQMQRGEQAPAGRVEIDWYRWNAQHSPLPAVVTQEPTAGSVVDSTISVAVPEGVTTNDVVVVSLYLETTAAVTAPTGFVQKSTIACTGGEAHTLRVYWRRAPARESGVYTFTWTGSVLADAVAQRVTGCITTGDPFEAVATAQRSSDATTTPNVSLTTLGEYRLLCWVGTAFNANAFTAPTGFSFEGVSLTHQCAAYVVQDSRGPTGNVSSTLSSTSNATAWLGALIPKAAKPPQDVDFEQVTVERSITGGLPPEVTLTTGISTTTATVDLIGNPKDNTQHPGVLYSPYQATLFATVQVEDTPATVELGQQINGTPELFSQLVGRVRDGRVVGPTADGASASVQLVDESARFHFPPSLPLVVGNDPLIPPSGLPQKPGLELQWVVDQIARQGGYYASPPVRDKCILSATLHGSAWPEVGTLRTASYWDGSSTSTAFPIRFAQGKYALATEDQPSYLTAPAYNLTQWEFGEDTAGNLVQTQGDTDRMYYEAWHYLSPTHNDVISAVYDSTFTTRRIFLRTDGAGHVGLNWSRNGAAYSLDYPATARITTTGWHYIAYTIFYGAGTTTIRIRVDGNLDTLTPATPSAYAPPGLGGVVLYTTGTEALQVTTEGYSTTFPFNDAFVPTAALEPGLSELTAMPPLPADGDAQGLLQDIAKAVAGTVLLDERGLFQFWNRRHWGAAGTAAGSVQKTIRATTALETATIERVADRIRTVVRATVSPFRVTPLTAIPVSSVAESIRGRGTLVKLVDMSPQQFWQVETTTGTIPSGGALINGLSGYRVARNQDGTGGLVQALTMTVQPSANVVRVSWHNPNSFRVWLVTPAGMGYPAGSVGQPAADIVARLVTATAATADTSVETAATILTEYRDEQAIADLGGSPSGERPLTLDPTVWLQNADDGQELVRDLGYVMSRPCPQLSGVQVILDATLQIGDMVRVLDDSGQTGLNDPYWVTGIICRQSADEATQTLTLRPVGPPGTLLPLELGMADRATLDGRWLLA